MRQRLYYLLPEIKSAREIVNELLLARIDESHIHVLAKDEEAISDLPRASVLQTTDIVHAIKSGLVVGGLTGLAVGLIAIISLSLSSMMGVVILATTIIGALLGIWISSMVGSGVKNSSLQHFEQAIESGEVLLMVDVPQQRIADVANKIEAHKEAHGKGTEPTIPAFP